MTRVKQSPATLPQGLEDATLSDLNSPAVVRVGARDGRLHEFALSNTLSTKLRDYVDHHNPRELKLPPHAEGSVTDVQSYIDSSTEIGASFTSGHDGPSINDSGVHRRRSPAPRTNTDGSSSPQKIDEGATASHQPGSEKWRTCPCAPCRRKKTINDGATASRQPDSQLWRNCPCAECREQKKRAETLAQFIYSLFGALLYFICLTLKLFLSYAVWLSWIGDISASRPLNDDVLLKVASFWPIPFAVARLRSLFKLEDSSSIMAALISQLCFGIFLAVAKSTVGDHEDFFSYWFFLSNLEFVCSCAVKAASGGTDQTRKNGGEKISKKRF